MTKQICIIGAAGQLGSALREAFADREVVAPAHGDFDIVNDAPEALLDRIAAGVVINCAAFHNVEQCEREPERAFAANAIAVDRLAKACAAREIAFATISTDYVFDGRSSHAYTESDATNPLSAYGASKLAGELLTRRHGDRHFIFRTSGVYGRSGTSNKGYTFVERILQQAEAGDPIRVVANMTFSPSYAPQVAAVMRAAIEAGAYGTYHVTNAGATTWYGFARAALDRCGLGNPIEAIRYDGYGSPVKRPLHSPLANDALVAAGIAPAPSWESGLDAFLAARRERMPVT